MIYKGIQCEKCKNEFTDNDDVVVCPVCGSPYHRACWTENNSCLHQLEHKNGFQWERPKTEPEPQEQKPVSPNEFMLKNGEKVIVCPKCSTLNCENDVYCVRCNSLLRKTDDNKAEDYNSANITDTNEQNEFRDKMYEHFNRFGGLNPNSELDGIPVCEYSDYVGGNSPGRIIRKIAIMERFGKKISACFPALFLGPIWFLWRKMVKEGLLISLVLIVLNLASGLLTVTPQYEKYVKGTVDVFESYVNESINDQEMMDELDALYTTYLEDTASSPQALQTNIAALLSSVATTGIGIFCSVFSMYFYRKKCKKSIMEIRNRCSNMQQYKNTLIHDGGTSAPFALIGVVAVLISLFCVNVLPGIIVFIR